MTFAGLTSCVGALMPFGLPELLVILLILVIIFGASKLPQLGKGLGEGIRNFKKGIREDKEALGDGESSTKEGG